MTEQCECGREVDKLHSATKKCEVCTCLELDRIRSRDIEENI